MQYFRETFTREEETILARHFTNLDGPVFALVNLPEVVKSALFARYSRSAKSMRRLFLDEFASKFDDVSRAPEETCLAGTDRARELFDKIFTEYGDDSVAQLGGAHIACEQSTNVLTKVLERGRLGSYLEQSTRYILFDKPLGDHYRYGVPREIETSTLASLYKESMDLLFRTYTECVATLSRFYSECLTRPVEISEGAWRASVRARVCDDLRGLLPASTLSNVGIFASGQAYEALTIKMRAHQLIEVREYGDLLLRELRKVIPSFVKRSDLPDRGLRWTNYLERVDRKMREISQTFAEEPELKPEVTLVEWDQEADEKLVAAALYSYLQLPDDRLLAIARSMTYETRLAVIESYCGQRENRRHLPGRAMERIFYRFDIIAPYSVFRDLQRHRMLTVDWQALTTCHGYDTPVAVEESGAAELWHTAMAAAADLYTQVRKCFGETVAQYVVPFAFKIRFNWHLNAREAFHILELRTQRGGDPTYRRICQEMHRLIREQAGHMAIADAMRFVDGGSYSLGRLESEVRAADRAAAAALR